MQKVNMEDLENISGGAAGLSGSDASADVMKENMASVCGMGSAKSLLPEGMDAQNTRTAKAFCPVCGKKTMIYISSGAQSVCSKCGNTRTDL